MSALDVSIVLRSPVSADHGEKAQLLALHRFVEETPSGEARLVGLDGTAHDLPASVHEVLVKILGEMARGRAVSVLPVDAQLTTQQAADLLGVSRPHVVKLVDDGVIPHSRPGKHRRLKLQDVLFYRDRQAVERRLALDDLTAESARLRLEY